MAETGNRAASMVHRSRIEKQLNKQVQGRHKTKDKIADPEICCH